MRACVCVTVPREAQDAWLSSGKRFPAQLCLPSLVAAGVIPGISHQECCESSGFPRALLGSVLGRIPLPAMCWRGSHPLNAFLGCRNSFKDGRGHSPTEIIRCCCCGIRCLTLGEVVLCRCRNLSQLW